MNEEIIHCIKVFLRKVWLGVAVSVLGTWIGAFVRYLCTEDEMARVFEWYSRIPAVLVAVAIVYRFFRIRRCPDCSPYGWWAGWRTEKRYVREVPPRELRPRPDQDFCTFDVYCHGCKRTFEAKAPELKSFNHRLALLRFW
jgi:hypothetical protein